MEWRCAVAVVAGSEHRPKAMKIMPAQCVDRVVIERSDGRTEFFEVDHAVSVEIVDSEGFGHLRWVVGGWWWMVVGGG